MKKRKINKKNITIWNEIISRMQNLTFSMKLHILTYSGSVDATSIPFGYSIFFYPLGQWFSTFIGSDTHFEKDKLASQLESPNYKQMSNYMY